MLEEGKRFIPKKTVVLVFVAIILIGVVAAGSQAIAIIPAGRKGVLLTWGQVTGILNEGMNFVTPFAQSVVLMDITIQKAQTNEATASSDLQEVTTEIAVNYRLIPSFVDETYKNFREDYETLIITPNIQESIKAVTALFRAEEFITKRSQIKDQFEEILESRLAEFNIQIISVSIVDITFSRSFTDAIEAKVVAEQSALEAKNKLEQIRFEAQQQIIQAEAGANATIARATAEAEAIRLIRESLTADYLQYLAIEAWDGVLPYLFGGGVIPFIEVATNSTG